MRFQDAAKDARAVVYAGIQADPLVGRLATLAADATYGQRLMARAVMNGESTDPATWRAIFPTVLGPDAPERDRAEAILAASLEVAGRGEQARSPVPRRVRRGADPGPRAASRRGRGGAAAEQPGPRSGASVGCSSTASLPRSIRTT